MKTKTIPAKNIKMKTHWAIMVNGKSVIYCANREVAEFMAESFTSDTHKVEVVKRTKDFSQ